MGLGDAVRATSTKAIRSRKGQVRSPADSRVCGRWSEGGDFLVGGLLSSPLRFGGRRGKNPLEPPHGRRSHSQISRDVFFAEAVANKSLKSQFWCGAEFRHDQRVPRPVPKLHATLAGATQLALVHPRSIRPPGEISVSWHSFRRLGHQPRVSRRGRPRGRPALPRN